MQLEALKALWRAVHEACKVPLEAPMTSKGLDTGVNLDVYKGKFKGFCNHYNITSKKIDCAGLHIDRMLEDIK